MMQVSPYEFADEKLLLVEDDGVSDKLESVEEVALRQRETRSLRRSIWFKILVIGLAFTTILFTSNGLRCLHRSKLRHYLSGCGRKPSQPHRGRIPPNRILDDLVENDRIDPLEQQQPVEVIEVSGTHDYHGPGVEFMSLVEKHVFGNTFGEPVKIQYTPPDEEFSDVILWISGSSYGRQYDRLGHVLVGGAEVWRFSTPEPANRNITWRAHKDVTAYVPLFKEPQEIELRLDNLVDETFTGPFTVSLHATFYRPDRDPPAATVRESYDQVLPPSDVIALSATTDNRWHLPKQSLSVPVAAVPRNVTRAVLDVFASGNAQEEFWYDHLDSPYSERFHGFGKYGPIRAVEVFVDGDVAGTVLPYPIVYTGGISPYLWRTVVGTGAYDVASYHVDLTPFLPRLWEGATVSLRVANGNRGRRRYDIESDWLINANLLTWQRPDVYGSGAVITDDADTKDNLNKITFGSGTSLSQVLQYKYTVSRRAQLKFTTPLGVEGFEVVWNQESAMSNVKSLGHSGDAYSLVEDSTIADDLLVDSEPSFAAALRASYSHTISDEYTDNTGYFDVSFVHTYETDRYGVHHKIAQNGTSSFHIVKEGVTNGTGALDTFYHEYHHNFDYNRHVKVRHSSIVSDHHWSSGDHHLV